MNSRIVAALAAVIVLAVGFPFVLNRHPESHADMATTVEVQEFDRLWRELEAIQNDTDETGRAVFKGSILSRTGKYLEFDRDQQAMFVAVVDRALVDLEAARARMLEVDRGTREAPETPAAVGKRREGWRRWQEEQRSAADRLLDALRSTSRHGLFAERRLLWLLRLDYGRRAAGAVGR